MLKEWSNRNKSKLRIWELKLYRPRPRFKALSPMIQKVQNKYKFTRKANKKD